MLKCFIIVLCIVPYGKDCVMSFVELHNTSSFFRSLKFGIPKYEIEIRTTSIRSTSSPLHNEVEFFFCI